jgi:5-methylcytosine-specific restriction endonuclease McrA
VRCGNESCGDKEVKHCPVCGGKVPPSLGTKPRKYCSLECGRRALKGIDERDRQGCFCKSCGIQIAYPGRGPRKHIFCESCRLASARDRRKNLLFSCACSQCGAYFESPSKKARFCSRDCRYHGAKTGFASKCVGCNASFKVMRPGQSYCSYRCSADHAAKKYNCLLCGVSFKKKLNVRSAGKYCTRECAFEARRRRLPCASRPIEVAKRLASWFLGWGEDQWPRAFKCDECGAHCKERGRPEVPETKCQKCLNRLAPPRCRDCGKYPGEISATAIMPDGSVRHFSYARKRCQECASARKRESSRLAKKASRKKHGHETTFRKRCRKYGVHYEPVSRRKVFDRDKWTCQICGSKLLRWFTKVCGTNKVHPRSPTIDHIIPLSLGPSACPGHVETNLQAACWDCNCRKGATHPDSFALVRRLD